ncbi:autophagy protein Apg6-domain-containing protein [Dichotomocladium elegans]|nr:autophagy protein Apg6-domain-containing protein [Dichotomocladium elegans]
MQAFICGRCEQPIRIDDSLTLLDPTTAELLTAPLSAEEQYQQRLRHQSPRFPIAADAVSKRHIKSTATGFNQSLRDSLPLPSESFVVLTRSQVGQSPPAPASAPAQLVTDDAASARNNTLSHRLRVANRLFSIISGKSSIDHPMCQECTDLLIESLSKELEDVSRERDAYIEFFENVKENRVDGQTQKEVEQQLKELKSAEAEALEELSRAQADHEAVMQELEEMEKEMEALDERERRFWQEFNEYELKLENFQNERDSINLKYDHDIKQYERLKRTVVYNDAFCISHDGPFGTINGFRLGRLHSHPVEWSEINAAWGQTLLLLYTVSTKLKFQFKTYRLVPMGSFSRVERVDGDSVVSYELYGSEFGLNRMFMSRRFDHAMVGLLSCLRQLMDFAEERDRTLKFPYRINKDKIGDVSIRVQFNQDENWTMALKYMLTNMKWVLVFASRANVAA